MTVTMRLVALLLAASFAGSAWPAPATPTDDRPRRHAHDGEDHRHHHHRRLFGPPPADVPRWADLSPDRQQRLERLRDRWEAMPPAKRVRVLHRLQRHDRWLAHDPAERERLRAGARNFREMPPALKATMRASFVALQRLPEAEREALQARWRALSPEARRAWLEAGGPGIVAEPDPEP